MDKKQLGQIIILVVLLGGLLISAMFMIRKMNPPRRTGNTPAQVVAEATDDAKSAGDKSGKRTEGGTSNVEDQDREFKEAFVNPNAFKSHALTSPRNPFIQESGWYSDSLEENMPGYPELIGSDYFEETVPYISDIDFIFDGEREWSSISVQRRQDAAYTISGESEDGRIQTQISLEQDIPSQASYLWENTSGVPLGSVKNPEYVRTLLARAPEPSSSSGGPLSGLDPFPLFGGEVPPLGGMPQDEQEAAGVLYCRGVSIDGDKASALLMIDGITRLVTKGQVLPPRFKIENITADGVILLDIQDESTQFVPLKGSQTESFPMM